MKKLLISLCSVFILAALTSCGAQSAEDLLPMDEEGKVAEQFMPVDARFVANIGPFDEEERGEMNAFLAKFPFEEEVTYVDLMSQFEEVFNELDISFIEEVQPAFGDNYRAVLAGKVHEQVSSEEGDTPIHLYNVGEPFLVAAITFEDSEKAYELLNSLGEKEGFISRDAEDRVVVAEVESGMQMTIVDDFFLITSDEAALIQTIATYESGEASMIENEEYLSLLGEYDTVPPVYFYLDPADLGLEESAGLTPLAMGTPNNNLKQMFGFDLDENGFSVEGYTKFDRAALKELGMDLSALRGKDLYMADEINGSGLMAYLETYNIAEGLKLGGAFEDEVMNAQFESFFGTNIEEGLFSWMDRGFVMGLYNGEGFLPGMTIAVDASSNVDAANQFYQTLDGQLSGLVALAQSSGEFNIEKSREGNMSVISVSLPDEVLALYQIPQEFVAALELSIGVTDNDFFAVSLQDGFASLHGTDVIGEDEKYDAALTQIGDVNSGVTFLDFDQIRLLVERYTQLIEPMYEAELAELEAEEAESEDEPEAEVVEIEDASGEGSLRSVIEERVENMDKIVSYLEVMDYAVLGNHMKSGHEIETKGYFKLK